jgi:hypothetical protein
MRAVERFGGYLYRRSIKCPDSVEKNPERSGQRVFNRDFKASAKLRPRSAALMLAD